MDYEKAYKDALERAKSVIKECGDNKGRITMIESIFPELAVSEDERIRKELIELIAKHCGKTCEMYLWLEKQGEQKPMWSEEDEKIFRALSNTLARISANTRTDSTSINYSFHRDIEWLKSLKDRYTWKPNVEQLTAFAQHLQKRGAFRDDLCMDFEHEAQSFIEFREYQNKLKKNIEL